jgi:uncharacterized protein (TIGR02231 family)
VPGKRGGHEVIVEHLPSFVDHDSVRVGDVGIVPANSDSNDANDSTQQHEKLVLLEVAPKSVLAAVPTPSDDNSKQTEGDSSGRDSEDSGLTPAQKLEALQRREQTIRRAQDRLRKQRAWLDSFGEVAVRDSPAGAKIDQPSAPESRISPSRLEEAAKFLEFQEDREADFDAREMASEEELKEIQAQIAVARASLARAGAGHRTEETTQVTVLLFLRSDDSVDGDDVEMEFELIYVVNGKAAWQPTYDCRVTAAGETGESAEIVYSGKITNNTGEDWNKCQLQLSTARPAVGGAPPKLPRSLVRWRTARHDYAMNGMGGGQFGSGVQMQQQVQMQQLAAVQSLSDAPSSRAAAAPAARRRGRGGVIGGLEGGEAVDEPEPSASVLTATVSSAEGASSATFTIPRLATVESDNRPHKVCSVWHTFSVFVSLARPN